MIKPSTSLGLDMDVLIFWKHFFTQLVHRGVKVPPLVWFCHFQGTMWPFCYCLRIFKHELQPQAELRIRELMSKMHGLANICPFPTSYFSAISASWLVPPFDILKILCTT